MSTRAVKRTLVGLITTLVVSAAAVVGWSRCVYKQWPWQSYPNPLSWCGRDWVPAGVQSRAQVEATDYDFHRAGDLPGLLNSGAVWTSRAKGAESFGTRCRITDVWVQVGTNKFEAMSLSGSF